MKNKKINSRWHTNFGSHTYANRNEVETTMDVNNQNGLKQADKVLKDDIEKEIKVLEDNICHTKKEKETPKRSNYPKDWTKQIWKIKKTNL